MCRPNPEIPSCPVTMLGSGPAGPLPTGRQAVPTEGGEENAQIGIPTCACLR